MPQGNNDYIEKMHRHGQLQALRLLVRQFLKGEGRNLNFLRALEGYFSEVVEFDSSEHFQLFGDAFTLRGASTSNHDDEMLVIVLERTQPELDSLIEECEQ